MTATPKLALLDHIFTWTCEMFAPPGVISGITFIRNNKPVAVLVHKSGRCESTKKDPRYLYECAEFTYNLIIPAENMTEFEQGSVWRCFYPGNGTYTSQNATLNVASKYMLFC